MQQTFRWPGFHPELADNPVTKSLCIYLELNYLRELLHCKFVHGITFCHFLCNFWSLQCLRVKQPVIYKVALLTHNVWATATPVYLIDLVQTHVPTWALLSSDAPLLVVSRTQTELAVRAFSVAASPICLELFTC